MSLDFDTFVYAVQVTLPAAVVMGFLGYLMGKVFQDSKIRKGSPAKVKSKGDSDLLIDDLLVDDLSKVSSET